MVTRHVLSIHLATLALLVSSHWAHAQTQSSILGAGQISEKVFNMLFSHPIDEDERVRERIGRGTTVGDSKTKGKVTVEVVPNARQAQIQFRLIANLRIPSAYAVQGPISARSSVASYINATKSVLIDHTGMTPRRAVVKCCTNMAIRGVWADRQFVQRMGRRMAQRQHGSLQNEINAKTRQRFAKRLDDRIQAAVDSSDNRIREMLGAGDNDEFALPPNVSFRSTADHVQLWINDSDPRLPKLASHVTLDPYYDLQFIAHDSALQTFANDQLAGRELSDQRLLRLVKRLRGTEPPALWVHARRPSWSMTCAELNPLTLKFEAQQAFVTLRLNAVSLGEEVFTGPIAVSFAIRPQLTSDGPSFERTAGPEVQIDSQTLTPDQRQIVHKLLMAKFEALIPDVAYFDGMQPPEGGSWDRVRALRIKKLGITDGWIEFAMKFRPGTMELENEDPQQQPDRALVSPKTRGPVYRAAELSSDDFWR